MIVLIDSRVTHNYIDRSLVENLGLLLQDTGTSGVTLGNGHSTVGREKCSGLILELQGLQVLAEFFSIELGSTDVILGMS